MEKEQAIYFRDQFREARAIALQDAEAFDEIVFVIERLGSFLKRTVGDLGQYKKHIEQLAANSPLAWVVAQECPESHIPFSQLYEIVRIARNDALHQGAFARHLTTHAIELSIVLEDALMNSFDKVGEFMVRNPICAKTWHPLSFVRQIMLENSFSYLPVFIEGKWKLVSDTQLASYLACEQNERKRRLIQSLESAVKEQLMLQKPHMCFCNESVQTALEKSEGRPVLILAESTGDLVGIITAFDML